MRARNRSRAEFWLERTGTLDLLTLLVVETDKMLLGGHAAMLTHFHPTLKQH